MQILFDNLAATLISTVVILLLATAHQRSQRVALEAIGQEALWEQQVSFIRDILRRDMAGVTSVENLNASLTDGSTFTFHTRHKSSSSEIEVTYKCHYVRTLEDGTDLYRIERLVGPPGARTTNGGSIATLVGWSARAFNEDGEEPSDLEAVRQIEVRIEASAPFEVNGRRRSQHWEATYRPVQLRGEKII